MQIPPIKRLRRLEVLERQDLPDRIPEVSEVDFAHVHSVGRIRPLEDVEELAQIEGSHVGFVVVRCADCFGDEFPDRDESEEVQSGEDAEEDAAGGDDGDEEGEEPGAEEVD